MRTAVVAICIFALCAVVLGSQVVARNAVSPTLKVGTLGGVKQVAVVSYKTSSGAAKHVLAWNGLDFRRFTPSAPQVQFKVNYGGGHGSAFGDGAWSKVKNRCVRNNSLIDLLPVCVYACSMSDGTHWALQSWQHQLPSLGRKPSSLEAASELHLSHFRLESLPSLWIKVAWDYYGVAQPINDHLYGTFSAHGIPASGAVGQPASSYTRSVYVDVLNDQWAKKGAFKQSGGWIRWASFVVNAPLGDFCVGVYQNQFGGSFPYFNLSSGYRAFAMGPGVTPIAYWEGPPPGTGNYEAGGFPKGYYSVPTVEGTSSPRGDYDELLNAYLAGEQQSIATKAGKCYAVHVDRSFQVPPPGRK